MVISAVLSGTNDWEAIELFGKNQFQWLGKYGDFQNGTPSDLTLCRLFATIDPDQFGQCFIEWNNRIRGFMGHQFIAIDGKRLRGSYDKACEKVAIHMVSAFASENGVCIGQVTTDQKSNEITAIPALLQLIMIKNSIVSIDAMGCQKQVAKAIVDKEGNYILAVKQNQNDLHQQVSKLFSITNPTSIDIKHDLGHGRIEKRKCTVIEDLTFLDAKELWKGINCVAKIDSVRINKVSKKEATNTRYYISSLSCDAALLNKAIRSHWSIENNLHWVLDVIFKEDGSRRRKGNSPQNFSLVTKIAMTMLKSQHAGDRSLNLKRFSAATNPEYREKIMGVSK